MIEEDWSELEADDNVCARACGCVRPTNQRIQSQISNLDARSPETHTVYISARVF